MAFTWKVVFLGESSVGKTSIITRYITGQFLRDNATIGAAFISHQLKISFEHTVQLEIWDTAGQERYRSLTTMYYRNTNVAIVVFDLSNFHIDTTFNDIDMWIEKLSEHNNTPNNNNDKLNIIIVGNKIDLLEENDDMSAIRETMLRYLDNKTNQNYDNIVLKYLEVSAKTGENVSNLFENVIVDLIPKDKLYSNDNNNNNNNNGEDQNNTNNTISLSIDSKKDKYIKNRQCNC